MKNLSLFLMLFMFANIAFSQVPQGIPYQAAAKSSTGATLANTTISIRFTIHDSVATGTTLYQETFSPTTNTQGVFSVNAGMGTPVTGIFSTINWGTNAKFMQVEMDPAGGSSYVDMGTTQMMSVPYAMYAAKASSISSGVLSSINNIDVFDSVGTFVWTVPSGVTKIIVECWGGGGGGGASCYGYTLFSGGGGGGYSKSVVIVIPDSAYLITVGTGGSVGNSGQPSTFNISQVVAVGGGSGSSACYPYSYVNIGGGCGGGACGSQNVGNITINGQTGSLFYNQPHFSGNTPGGNSPLGGNGGSDGIGASAPGGGGGGNSSGMHGRVVITY